MKKNDRGLLKRLIQSIDSFEDREISLGDLVSAVETVRGSLEDEVVRNAMFEDLLALEEVNAFLTEPDFDFAKYGKAVLKNAVASLRRIASVD